MARKQLTSVGFTPEEYDVIDRYAAQFGFKSRNAAIRNIVEHVISLSAGLKKDGGARFIDGKWYDSTEADAIDAEKQRKLTVIARLDAEYATKTRLANFNQRFASSEEAERIAMESPEYKKAQEKYLELQREWALDATPKKE